MESDFLVTRVLANTWENFYSTNIVRRKIPMSEATLELTEFEQLVHPLRRLKVSLVWRHLCRDGDTAKGLRSVAGGLRLAGHDHLARGYEDAATKLEVNPGRITFSTLTLELGALERTYDHSANRRGQASVHFGTCWRVESPHAIAFSSKSEQSRIDGC